MHAKQEIISLFWCSFFFTDYLERAIEKFVSAAEDFDKRVKSVDVTE